MEEAKWTSMRKLIVNNLVFITQSTTNLTTLLIHLIQSEAISPTEKQKIESNNILETQIYELMMLLTRKGHETYESLIDALKASGNIHILNKISMFSDEAPTMNLSFVNHKSGQNTNPLLEAMEDKLMKLDGIIDNAQIKLTQLNEKQIYAVYEVPVDKHRPGTATRPFKITAVGESFVGKSCMHVVWTTGYFPLEICATIGKAKFTTVLNIQGQYVSLNLWDTAGHERYDQLTAHHLTIEDTDVILLTYDISAPKTLDLVANRFMPLIRMTEKLKNVPIILIGNKLDLRNESSVTKEQGVKIADEINAVAYIECSARTGEGMKCVLETAVKMAYLNPKADPSIKKSFRCPWL